MGQTSFTLSFEITRMISAQIALHSVQLPLFIKKENLNLLYNFLGELEGPCCLALLVIMNVICNQTASNRYTYYCCENTIHYILKRNKSQLAWGNICTNWVSECTVWPFWKANNPYLNSFYVLFPFFFRNWWWISWRTFVCRVVRFLRCGRNDRLVKVVLGNFRSTFVSEYVWPQTLGVTWLDSSGSCSPFAVNARTLSKAV